MELPNKESKRVKDNNINNNIINEMTIEYIIQNENTIKLFGNKFIKNNKNNCKIIIEKKN